MPLDLRLVEDDRLGLGLERECAIGPGLDHAIQDAAVVHRDDDHAEIGAVPRPGSTMFSRRSRDRRVPSR